MTRERTDATKAFYLSGMGAQHDPHHHVRTTNQQATEKCKMINVIISNEAKTLHFIG